MKITKRLLNIDSIALCVAIVALLVSWKSCNIAQTANKYALAQTRPYLEITPISTNGNFVVATAIDTNTTLFEIVFKVHNKGISPAHDLCVLPESTITFHSGPPIGSWSKPIGNVNSITLGPDEKWGFAHRQQFMCLSGSSSSDEFRKLFEDGRVSFDVTIALSYRGTPGEVNPHIRKVSFQFIGKELHLMDSSDE